MKLKSLNHLLGVLLVSASLVGCEYSNTFQGTYNGAPAELSAYSKNVNRYCISLKFKGDTVNSAAFISVSDVFDESDLLRAKSFNTKGTACNRNLSDYRVGVRTPTVLSKAEVMRSEQITPDLCQWFYYMQYTYQDRINFSVYALSNDSLTGAFDGVGEVKNYTDYSRPTRAGRVYYCGPGMGYPGGGFPGGYPRGGYPRGGYPRW